MAALLVCAYTPGHATRRPHWATPHQPANSPISGSGMASEGATLGYTTRTGRLPCVLDSLLLLVLVLPPLALLTHEGTE